uniref:Chemokine vCXCL4 n=1 Tax=Simian cytomegalovirus (strain Colburn) TaxID=50292 RepID=D2E308_SCMVC|nr:chemokine vCXCL4 [Cercopithecine betaherpesvirus 5]
MQYSLSHLLVATLLGTLLASTMVFADKEERCLCPKTIQGIHPKNIQSVELHEPRDMCPNVEVIAKLKNGNEVCLNTEGPMVKKIIEKMRDREIERIQQQSQ